MRTAWLFVLAPLVLAGCCARNRCCAPAGPRLRSEPAPSGLSAPGLERPRASAAPSPVAPPTARAAAANAPARSLQGTVRTAKSLTMSGTAQVTLQNSTSITLDLYVDGGYGCRALKNLMCTTHVTPGTITLEARGPNGESASTTATVNAGDSVTWTVTEE